MGNILVLNMGMKSIRSIIFSVKGEKLAFSNKSLSTSLTEERVEQDPGEWWEKAREVIGNTLVDVSKDTIEYITVTASSSCLLCCNHAMEPLTNCIMVSDKRAVDECEYIEALDEFRLIKKNMGIQMNPGMMLPKILWIKNHALELFLKASYFLSPNDYLVAKMTGRCVTDPFNAMKMYYDVRTGKYPENLLKKLEISAEKLPEVNDIGTEVGHLTSEAAEFLGLTTDVKAVLTTYDAICSFFGSGVSEEGDASDVSGTVTVFRALSRRDDLADNQKIFTMRDPKHQLNIIGGSNNLGGGLIEWAKQCYYQKEEYPYEVMEKDAREARPGADGVIFLPYLLGERAPIWNDNARGVFFGLERMHTRKEMTRAVFESTGFIDMTMIQAIEETGMKIKRIRLSGGLARIHLISEIKADITGRDVEVLDEFETTSTGAAILALNGMGEYLSLKDATEHFAKVRMVIHPNANNHEIYKQIYRLYTDAYRSMTDLFNERMHIIRSIYSKHETRIENL